MSQNMQKPEPPHLPARIAGLSAQAWVEAARICTEAAFATTLNTWHYSVSLARTAESAVERIVAVQRRLVRDLLRN